LGAKFRRKFAARRGRAALGFWEVIYWKEEGLKWTKCAGFTHTHTHIYILSWAKRNRHHGLGLKANKNMHKFMGC
jgi:hypothetical protein